MSTETPETNSNETDASKDKRERQALLKHLSDADLFSGLNEEQLGRVADVGSITSYKKNDFVFKEGDEGTALYVVCRGAVRVSRNVAGMGEEAFAILKPGSLFGEMSVFDDSPRSADAIVHESCALFCVEKEAFHTLLKNNRLLACEVLWKMVKLMSNRLRQTNDKMAFMTMCGKF